MQENNSEGNTVKPRMALRTSKKRINYRLVPHLNALNTSRPGYLKSYVNYRQRPIKKMAEKTRITRSSKNPKTSVVQAQQSRIVKKKRRPTKKHPKSDSLKIKIDPSAQKFIRGTLPINSIVYLNRNKIKKNLETEDKRDKVRYPSQEALYKKQGQSIQKKRRRPQKSPTMKIIEKDQREEQLYTGAIIKALQILKVDCWSSLIRNLLNIQRYLEDSQRFGDLNIKVLPSKLETMDKARIFLNQTRSQP